MKRRRFIVATASSALTAIFGGGIGLAQPAGDWRNLLDDLPDALESAEEYVEWLDWSVRSTTAIKQKKAPPPAPGQDVSVAALQQQKRVSALILPEYRAALPSTAALPTMPDIARSEMRRRLRLLADAAAELQESVSAIKYLNLMISSTQQHSRQLENGAKALEEIAKGGGGAMWEELVHDSLDAQKAARIVSDTRDILVEKQRDASTRYTQRRSVIQSSASDIRLSLANESEALTAEADRLIRLDSECKVLEARAADASKARETASNEVNRAKTFVQAIKLDQQNLEESIRQARLQEQQFRARISELKEELKKPYICPESKADWDNCKDKSHRIFKDKYLRDREIFEHNLGVFRRRLEENLAAVKGLISSQNEVKQRLRVSEQELVRAENILQSAEERSAKATAEAVEMRRSVTEERWKSRADLFKSENANDQTALSAIVGSIGRGT